MTTPRRDRKRKGSPEWIRLGELLAARRAELSPDYEGHGGRMAFARDRLPPTPKGNVNLRLAQDIELNGRENFTPPMLRDVIAPAYGVTYESIRRALEGGGLEPAAGPTGSASLPTLAPPVAMDEELEKAARPHIGMIGPANLAAVARGWDPPGDQLFEAGSWEAETWERLRRGFRDPYRRLWVIAATLGGEDVESGIRHGAAGLTGAALGRGSSAGGTA